MIIINNKKFAKNNKELTESLFKKGGTCSGTYRVYKKQIALYNLQGEKIAVVTKNRVLLKATKLEKGFWYNFGYIKELELDAYNASNQEINDILDILGGSK